MSPSDIEFLIWCHCRAEVHPRSDAPAILDVTSRFLDEGLIEQRTEDYYHTTARGRAMISSICSTPLPVEAWADQNGNVIEF